MQDVEIKKSTTQHIAIVGGTYRVSGSQDGVSLARLDKSASGLGLHEMYTVRINNLDEMQELEVLLAEVKAHFAQHGRAETLLRCPMGLNHPAPGAQWNCGCKA